MTIERSGQLSSERPRVGSLARLPSRPRELLLPCEETFERLATEEPARLALWIEEATLDPTDLTFAAEYLGLASDRPLVLRALLPLLEHPKPYVREGALLGLGRHLAADMEPRLRSVVSDDPAPEIRALAQGLLDELVREAR